MKKIVAASSLFALAGVAAFAATPQTWLELGQEAAARWQAAGAFECDYTLDAMQAGIAVKMQGKLLAVPDGNDGKFSMHGNIVAADNSEYPLQFLYADGLFYMIELREEGAQGRQSLPEPLLFLPPAGPALFRLLEAAWQLEAQPGHQHDPHWRCFRGTPKEGVTIAIPFKQLDICLDAETLHARRVEWREGPADTQVTVAYGPAVAAADFDAARLNFNPPPGANIQWLSAPPAPPTAEISPPAQEDAAEATPNQP